MAQMEALLEFVSNKSDKDATGPLISRVGGPANVIKIVELFYRKLYSSERLAKLLEGVDLKHLEAKQSAFMTWLFGSDDKPYGGRHLRSVHLRLIKQRGFAPQDFEAGMAAFESSMREVGVKEHVLYDVMAKIWPIKDVIFTPRSSDVDEEARWANEEFAKASGDVSRPGSSASARVRPCPFTGASLSRPTTAQPTTPRPASVTGLATATVVAGRVTAPASPSSSGRLLKCPFSGQSGSGASCPGAAAAAAAGSSSAVASSPRPSSFQQPASPKPLQASPSSSAARAAPAPAQAPAADLDAIDDDLSPFVNQPGLQGIAPAAASKQETASGSRRPGSSRGAASLPFRIAMSMTSGSAAAAAPSANRRMGSSSGSSGASSTCAPPSLGAAGSSRGSSAAPSRTTSHVSRTASLAADVSAAAAAVAAIKPPACLPQPSLPRSGSSDSAVLKSSAAVGVVATAPGTPRRA
ncbi:hypothetical protein HYH03_015584 [Edaphochlamys debaryana]|uniref:Globin n=1 Tax=Edaphochlamys debaryana TaxID=47281 RepID=A0A835XLI7_9CHLO|nr:hypothetical protein HYH03_015584 [Edaphochlamys debaryana]|eukprot:KAG2485699.1 hypothetical protein HYH03_015584 [Edaphochlamys debaryana]